MKLRNVTFSTEKRNQETQTATYRMDKCRLTEAVEKCQTALNENCYPGWCGLNGPIMRSITPIIRELCDTIDLLSSEKDYKFLEKIYAQQQEIDRLTAALKEATPHE